MPEQSSFFYPGAVTKADSLAIVQLSKGDFVPVYLRKSQGEHDGYKEGHVLNTRFGSFPHSTLIGIPWGSQVRASIVDTGTRGRRKKPLPQPQGEGDGIETSEGLKRKRDSHLQDEEGEKRAKSSPPHGEAATPAEDTTATEQAPAEEAPPLRHPRVVAEAPTAEDANSTPQAAAETAHKQPKTSKPSLAQSGFIHILPPTPEVWTTSLPHRTQVVYTPDYSYILQRLRTRPGTRLIEAGSGSGSFTHAAARAVYDGAPHMPAAAAPPPTGRVFSFEFHEQRFRKMAREVHQHGLGGVVTVAHRDVYSAGFLVGAGAGAGASPGADAIFLDLPAPWLALPHLTRRRLAAGAAGVEGAAEEGAAAWVSPLNPKKSVYICTFSPCIEQVTRTVAAMRKLGWVEIDMVEIAHKRMHVFRDKIGIDLFSDRGQQLAPKNVAEAIRKLREIGVKSAAHNAKMLAQHQKRQKPRPEDEDEDEDMDRYQEGPPPAPAPKVNGVGDGQVVEEESKDAGLKPFMQGQLVTRPESELKAHTSYLVFAILPREWSEEDEAAAAAKWPTGNEPRMGGPLDRAARKQLKRDQLQSKRKKNKKEKVESKGEAADPTTAEVHAGYVSLTENARRDEDVKMGGES